MARLERPIAVSARWPLTVVQVTELNAFSLNMWPIFWVLRLVVTVQVLYAPQKLVTETASCSHVLTCIGLLQHVVPIARTHYGENSASPLLIQQVPKVCICQWMVATDWIFQGICEHGWCQGWVSDKWPFRVFPATSTACNEYLAAALYMNAE